MKKLLVIVLMLGFIYNHSFAQGCVAIRSTGGFCTAESMAHHDKASPWVVGINNRYFKSYKHFVGTEEQKERVEKGTEVINHSYTLDILVTRNLNDRWSFTLDVPVISNARSSLYEHDGKNRYSTHSFGLGDLRLTAYAWILDPVKMPRGNVQFGLGLKFPTGDYRYQDFFIKSDSVKVLGPVDQSIQLGDGGTGFSTELNGFFSLNKTFTLYGNFFYLFNPREQNGTSTARGGTPSASNILYGSSTMSVPDQFMARGGVSATLKSFSLSVGLRDDCLPSQDLIGGSSGFRRPGYIVSIEPGMTYSMKKLNLYAYVPVALKRNRTQSYADKKRTAATGVYTQGDAAFADYVVNVGAAIRF
jgi:hypothetical protein